jgi:protein NRD1
VRAARLSGSRVKELSESALRIASSGDGAEVDALVATLVRLHSGLAAGSQARVSSLYVFDAVARDAKRAADKGKSGAAAALLTKMEGEAENWVGAMMEDGRGGTWTEGRVSARSKEAGGG